MAAERISSSWSRRQFLRAGTFAAGAVALGKSLSHASDPAARPLFSAYGIAASLDQAADLKMQGAQFLTVGVGGFLVPDKGDDVFARHLERLASSPLPILACNGFIRPPHLRCVGADATHDLVLAWADTCFQRLRRAGGKFIVFGSSGSRQLRDGWSKAKADEQFITLLKRMGPLAAAQGITIAVEQLQASECNYINHIGEGAAIIRAVGHPQVRLLADLYHMACMGDTPADLEAAMDVVEHVEIAEKTGRTVPGVSGDDFRPYLRVLRARGYVGAISIEGKWELAQVGPAFAEIARQSAQV